MKIIDLSVCGLSCIQPIERMTGCELSCIQPIEKPSGSGLKRPRRLKPVNLPKAQGNGGVSDPAVIFPEAAGEINPGDSVAVDFDTGVITNETTGKTYQAQPYPEFLQNIIRSGGLMESIKG